MGIIQKFFAGITILLLCAALALAAVSAKHGLSAYDQIPSLSPAGRLIPRGKMFPETLGPPYTYIYVFASLTLRSGAIAFFIWMYLAAQRSAALAHGAFTYPPRWCLWHALLFIPATLVASVIPAVELVIIPVIGVLVVPRIYRIMQELWATQRMPPPINNSGISGKAFDSLFVFLLAVTAFWHSFEKTLATRTNDLMIALRFELFSEALSIILLALAICYVGGIQRRQQAG